MSLDFRRRIPGFQTLNFGFRGFGILFCRMLRIRAPLKYLFFSQEVNPDVEHPRNSLSIQAY